MKHLIIFALIIFSVINATAQKSKIKSQPTNLSFLYKKGDHMLMATINKGDRLVYHCNVLSYQYDLIITINDFTETKIDINYSMTNSEQTKGHIIITGSSYKTARRYITVLSGKAGEMKLDDVLAFWFSEENFKELETGNKTTIKLDDNGDELYQVSTKSTDIEIKYKGDPVKIESMVINNQKSIYDKPTKSITLLNNLYNRLIIKMNFGSGSFGRSIELKEIK